MQWVHVHTLKQPWILCLVIYRVLSSLFNVQVDCGLGEEVVVVKVPGLPGNRLVFASTGPVNRDYDDVRRFSDAASNGIKRCLCKHNAYGVTLSFVMIHFTPCEKNMVFLLVFKTHFPSLKRSFVSLICVVFAIGLWKLVFSALCWCALHITAMQETPLLLCLEPCKLSMWWVAFIPLSLLHLKSTSYLRKVRYVSSAFGGERTQVGP